MAEASPPYFRILLSVGLIVVAMGLLFTDLSLWVIILGSIILVHWVILWGQLSPYSQLLGPVVTRFSTSEEKREIWLTLDDGPDPEETPAVLDQLDRFGVRATFFLIGEKAAAHPELVREIHRRGHQVANHTFRHRQYLWWALPFWMVRKEIDRSADVISHALGKNDLPPLFRSPVGMKPLFLHPLLARRGLHLIGWTTRGRDGARNPDLRQVLARLEAGTKSGAILVLHEGRGHAPELLGQLLPRLQEAGFEAVIPSPDRFVSSGRR